MNNYLEHYGVPGMRWGRRKSVNSPAVITLGPGQYRSTGSSNGGSNNKKTSSSNNSNSNPAPRNNNGNSNTSNKFDIKATQAGLKEGKKIADAGAKYLDNDRKKQTAKDLKKEAKSMTDDDLRQVINRLNMEERYVQAMEKEGVGRSKTDLQKTLEIVGTAVSYADTALSVYDKIQEIRSR